MRVEAWEVHDTGLVTAPGPFRRLPGSVRHHQGRGDRWPPRVVLELDGEALVVTAPTGALVGRWGPGEVTLRRHSDGPPVMFVVQLEHAAHLLGAPADDATDALLAAFESTTR